MATRTTPRATTPAAAKASATKASATKASGAARTRRTTATTTDPTSRPQNSADAAADAVEQNLTSVNVPWVGKVSLPPVDHIVWYAAVGALTAVELIEWPIAVVLAAGKMLADSRTHRTLRSFGEALEEAG